MAGEMWVQWFSCCVNQPAAQRRKRVRQQVRRIDRSMIGSPTNFQHTGHIGSGDVDMGNSHLRAIQNQMQSKGGYETAFTTVKHVWVLESATMDTFSKLAAHSVYHQNKKDSLMDTTAVRKCLQWDPAGWSNDGNMSFPLCFEFMQAPMSVVLPASCREHFA
ncbi:hypothetical protein Cfor_10129 [Coptotermes formosanus]|uniref:CRIB domain-containing protein n=1 Tax=Coptotermes formosanus TaxID=36987 RepID=A0A6L2PUX1_COPFO|nr:hypothetical protein Cfor_10129 [Coptotermes formosanus]